MASTGNCGRSRRIEALRPASELETAINALRTDLTDIGRSLTEALPRRAVESLEIEIKALGQRIDHSRESGVDSTALAGLERGLQDVREAAGRVWVEFLVTRLGSNPGTIKSARSPVRMVCREPARE